MFQSKLSIQVLTGEKDNVVAAIERIWGLWLGEMVVCAPERVGDPCQNIHIDDNTAEFIQQLRNVPGVQVMYW